MPRARKPGGVRAGAPATAYPNRTDLSQNKTIPQTVATGQQYGKAQGQLNAMRTIPMAAPPQIGMPGPALPASPAAPAPSPATPGAGAAPIPQGPMPGELGSLFRPTDRPNEPVTAGAPMGAGPGPEAAGPFTAQQDTLGGLLNALARTSGYSEIQDLASLFNNGGR